MSDQFVAEIRIFPFNFPPKGWATCDGQILPLAQNTALFSLLGTTYGGDGKSNFALPNLGGNAPMHPGQGPGLSSHNLGETGGTQTVTLLASEIPAHTHQMYAVNDGGLSDTPGSQITAQAPLYSTTNAKPATMSFQALSVTGGSQPHNNMQPYLTLTFCIALQGIFPPRS